MKSPDFQYNIKEITKLIIDSNHVIAITGAGISTPSGIPDFRSNGTGLWETNDPMKVASLSAFNKNPRVFFDWLRPLITEIQKAKPNNAHFALAELEKRGYIKSIITQNIDDLHNKAHSINLIEIHGSLNSFQCPKCFNEVESNDEIILRQYIITNVPPLCPMCGNFLKPKITLYEEQLPQEAWKKAYDQCSKADLILIIGTSLEVTPVNYLPQLGLEKGANIVINTFSQTYLDIDAAIIMNEDVCKVWSAVVKEIDKYDKHTLQPIH